MLALYTEARWRGVVPSFTRAPPPSSWSWRLSCKGKVYGLQIGECNSVYSVLFVCVCVCVWARETWRERGSVHPSL